jgi:hypothetical protein
VTDCVGVKFLLDQNFFQIYKTREEVIFNQEIAMSQLFLKNGWTISCLVPEYQCIDYTKPLTVPVDDIRNAKKLIGRNLSPYEVIFIKSLWGDPTGQIISLMRLNMPQMEVNRDTCQKVIYGVSPKKGIDVTKNLKQSAITNVSDMLPNTRFGDPDIGKPKWLWIYLEHRQDPVTIKEYCGRLSYEPHRYLFYLENGVLQLFSYK